MSKKHPRLSWTVYNGAVYGLSARARPSRVRTWVVSVLLLILLIFLLR